jgi:hypothetical protein
MPLMRRQQNAKLRLIAAINTSVPGTSPLVRADLLRPIYQNKQVKPSSPVISISPPLGVELLVVLEAQDASLNGGVFKEIRKTCLLVRRIRQSLHFIGSYLCRISFVA